ncbi:lasso peptide biosynthesis PqqD family chaperone [Fodinicola acaciae]|uniref:lasso peptide biosynthesis PqqD family chaperone n=1 Tax=Fodinicola acaciae TaxID=2681555 RepID=UPI0013D203BA|nr:lasso peptide biosynthesis PqqD family chaperone [Fodinicola acaciae]
MRLADGVAATDTADGLVLLNQRTGIFWQVNGSGRMVVQLLLAGNDQTAAVGQLVRSYRVSTQQAADDVAALVAQLRSAGLVTG